MTTNERGGLTDGAREAIENVFWVCCYKCNRRITPNPSGQIHKIAYCSECYGQALEEGRREGRAEAANKAIDIFDFATKESMLCVGPNATTFLCEVRDELIVYKKSLSENQTKESGT